MRFQFWSIGKTHESFVKEGIELFTKRINNYYPATWNIIPVPKNASALSETELKKKEAELILSMLGKDDFLVLLDEKGKQLSSPGLADLLQQRANAGAKNLVFLIGGAFGVHNDLYKKADHVWSLSSLVFPHQLVRLILAEQVYRACSILRNEKYHHS